MKSRLRNFFVMVIFSHCIAAQEVPAQVLLKDNFPPSKELVYKVIDTLRLKLTVYHPKNFNPKKQYPAILFFFGGGWKSGSISQFEQQAKYFASRGMVSVLAYYRVASRNNTSPFEAVKDARSAIRYLKIHSKILNIDSTKIVASGGSAGGHLASACDLIDINENGEDTSISTKPAALVLFNPVIDNGPGGYGYDRIKHRYKEISPLHNIKKGAAPAILFFGSEDKFVPVNTAKLFKQKMDEVSSRCDLHIYENQQHGFFSYVPNTENVFFKKTVYEADMFLVSLGILKGKPTIMQYQLK